LAKADEETHASSQSAVGILLYLVKHLRPDKSNAVRKLSKVMDAPSLVSVKELKKAIKFAIHTENFSLNFNPDKIENRK
jgi:hypothetical protein